MLLDDERYLLKWLSQYGTMTRAQAIKMLRKPEPTATKIIRNLVREQRIAELNKGEVLALDELCKVNPKMDTAIWVLLQFVDKVRPLAHYPATYPSQLFFLKENTGYEIVTIYEGEEHLLKLLQPDEDLKYIIVIPHISMASKLKVPNAPCLFATVDFNGKDEPEITFYSEGEIADETKEFIPKSAG